MQALDRGQKKVQTCVWEKWPENTRTWAQVQCLRGDLQLELMQMGLHEKINIQQDHLLEWKTTHVWGKAHSAKYVWCWAYNAQPLSMKIQLQQYLVPVPSALQTGPFYATFLRKIIALSQNRTNTLAMLTYAIINVINYCTTQPYLSVPLDDIWLANNNETGPWHHMHTCTHSVLLSFIPPHSWVQLSNTPHGLGACTLGTCVLCLF